MQSSIYHLTLQNIQDEEFLQNIIYKDLTNEYYWSEDWSEEFYVLLAKKGFITITYNTKDGLILLPELQLGYAVLDFDDLHISKKVNQLIKQDNYVLQFNRDFEEVLARFDAQHKNSWMIGKYVQLMKNLHRCKDSLDDFELISVELISKKSGELIAGEIGYKIAKTYTSLSGFSSKDKQHNNCGTLQLVLLAQHLKEDDFLFWNLGHPHMEYKKRLGCTTYPREKFLQRWHEAILDLTYKNLSIS